MFEAKLPTTTSNRKTGSYQRKSNVSIVKRAGEPGDRTLGCRYELKYRIGESQAALVAQFIKPYLHLDRYCKLQPSGVYPIGALYLDSGDFKLCRETLEGKHNRFKLRIRSYTDEPDYPCFFEIKRRFNNIIIKSRARVMRQDIATLLSGRPLPLQNYNTNDETLNQFKLYMSYINARPVIRIRYMRQAYEGGSYNRVRVTFDRELAYNVTSLPEVRLSGGTWQRVPLNFVILEIKFTGRYPAWLGRMVGCLNLRRSSMSKYASAIKQSCSLGFCAPPLVVW